MNSLYRYVNFPRNFYSMDVFEPFRDIDVFFRPFELTNRFFEVSSDEEIPFRRRNKNLNKKFIKMNPKQLKGQSFCKSFYTKTSLNKEGKPVTYSYENETENKYENGHEFRKSSQIYRNKYNGKEKSQYILEKEIDGKLHKIVKTNENGKNNEKCYLKGIKEEELEEFNKQFEEGISKKNFLQLNDEENNKKDKKLQNENEKTENKKEQMQEINTTRPKNKKQGRKKVKCEEKDKKEVESSNNNRYSLRSQENAEININQSGDSTGLL